MKKIIISLLSFVLVGCSSNVVEPSIAIDPTMEPVVTSQAQEYTGIPVPSQNGKLHVEGTQLVDENNQEVQLRGVSTHGLAWFPDYVNNECFSNLKDWGSNVVRLALYTHEYNGYCAGGNQEELKQLVEDGVEYATNNDMYVIIDWHVLNEGDPNTYKQEAIKFFDGMSEKYSSYNNVIYEICNEPCNGTSWDQIKTYANEVIPTIRNNDEDSVIIVGTPNWSQDVDIVSEDPLEFGNVMYALHFYAATHKDDLRNKLKIARNNGLPIFVSEFGICDASGNGNIDETSANQWISLLDEYNISYVCWNLSNKNEASALIQDSCSKTSDLTEDDLSDEGKWLYNVLQGHQK